MTNIRFLNGIETPKGESFVYIELNGEGWFSFRQLIEMFFPGSAPESLKFTIWCAQRIRSSAYYDTEISECVLCRLRDTNTLKKLYHLGVKVDYIVNVHSTQKILHVLNPCVSARILMRFNKILSEFLRKGGRKRAISFKERMQIAACQEWKCNMCNAGFGQELNFEIDHVFQWSEGGSNRSINLQALCPNCHAQKTYQDKNHVFERFKHLSVNDS